MYVSIQEPIAVIGSYRPKHTFLPRKFRWQAKEYAIENITWQSDIQDGGIKKRLYSVVANKQLFRLEFHRENECWVLCELWVEEGL